MRSEALDFGNAGYRPAYRADQANACPGCGRAHWVLGRMTAECAFCGTAIPLAEAGSRGTGVFRHGGSAPRSGQWLAA